MDSCLGHPGRHPDREAVFQEVVADVKKRMALSALRPAPTDYEDLRKLRRLACKAWRHDLTRQQVLDALQKLRALPIPQQVAAGLCPYHDLGGVLAACVCDKPLPSHS